MALTIPYLIWLLLLSTSFFRQQWGRFRDGAQSPSHKVNQSEFWQTKPAPTKKPDRPMAPPKPTVPARPKPPTPYNNGY